MTVLPSAALSFSLPFFRVLSVMQAQLHRAVRWHQTSLQSWRGLMPLTWGCTSRWTEVCESLDAGEFSAKPDTLARSKSPIKEALQVSVGKNGFDLCRNWMKLHVQIQSFFFFFATITVRRWRVICVCVLGGWMWRGDGNPVKLDEILYFVGCWCFLIFTFVGFSQKSRDQKGADDCYTVQGIVTQFDRTQGCYTSHWGS